VLRAPRLALAVSRLLLVLLAGCGAEIYANELRAVGAADLKCPAKRVVVEQISREHGGFTVSGCKQTKQYDCNKAFKKGRSASICYSAPTSPADAARWEASWPLECDFDKITVKVMGNNKVDPDAPLKKNESRGFMASGCGRKQKIGCQYRDVPGWPKCYTAK
jgi:hypothetical protein